MTSIFTHINSSALIRNYKKYLKAIINHYKGYSSLIELKYIEYESMSDSVYQKNTSYTLDQLLNTHNRIQIFGNPGSGKTSALLKSLHALSIRALEDNSLKFPVFLEFSDANIFNKVISFLHVNNFAKDISSINISWLKNELSKGKFIFLIDDLHKLNYIDKDKTHIDELLSYNKNTFVLMSRDYYTRNDFGFKSYHTAKLTEDEIKSILILNFNNNEIENIFHQIRFQRDLQLLYNTPQMLVFLGKIVNKFGNIPQNKTELFNLLFKFRSQIEVNKDSLLNFTSIEQRKIILSFLAYEMFLNPVYPYLISIEKCILYLTKKQSDLSAKGFNSLTGENLLLNFLKEGYLIRFEDEIKFEHDQWQEYFAACHIYNNSLPLKFLNNILAIKEISFFVGGFHTFEEDENKKRECAMYLEELLELDYFLFVRALHNYNKRETLADFASRNKNNNITIQFVKNSFAQFLYYYNYIINHHFPNLRSKFYPTTLNDIGVVVMYKKDSMGFWFGFKEELNDFNKVEVIEVQSESSTGNGPPDFQSFPFLDGMHARYPEDVIYKLPIIGAYSEISSQLREIINSKKLIEPTDMNKERLYYELLALKHILYIDKKKDYTVNIFLEGFIKLKIEKEIFGNYLVGNHLNLRELKVEVNRLYLENYVPQDIEYGTTYHGIHSYPVNDKDVERRLKELILSNAISNNSKLESILPYSLIQHNHFTYDKYSELNNADKIFIREWYKLFYLKLYCNYFEMVERNFPSIKKYFTSYLNQPLLILLLENGEKHIYSKINDITERITVKCVNNEEYEYYDNKYKRNKWLISPTFIKSSSTQKELLRESIYKLLKDEYRIIDQSL